MCYSTSLRKKKEALEKKMNASFEIPLEYTPYFHLNGFSHGNLYIVKMDEPDKIYPASWGLVPSWGNTDIPSFRKKYNTLNAKMETLLTSGTYKESARDQRCLILADGFFEPQKVAGVSIPNYCYIPSNEEEDSKDLFCFGGIYSELEEDSHSYSCSIITMPANPFFEEIHNVKKRMPLVLDPQLYQEWFDDGLNDANITELMAHGFTSQDFAAHPVSRDLYKKGVDTNKPYILSPTDKTTLF